MEKLKNLVIFGISETAERVKLFVERYKLFNVIGFTVDGKYIKEQSYLGKPVWALEELDQHIDRNRGLLFVAILWDRLNRTRRDIYERLKAMGYNFATIISPLASVRSKSVGGNCWFMDFVVAQEASTIGDNVFLADYAKIGHLTRLKNHCFISVGATVLGGKNWRTNLYWGKCNHFRLHNCWRKMSSWGMYSSKTKSSTIQRGQG